MKKLVLGGLMLAVLLIPATAQASPDQPVKAGASSGQLAPAGARAASTTSIYSGYSRAGQASSSYGGRWNVYEGGYSRIGYISRSYGGRWNIYEGYSRVGYVSRSYGGRWNCYDGYSRAGYTSSSYGGRWNIYAGYSRVGYASGVNSGPSDVPRWCWASSEISMRTVVTLILATVALSGATVPAEAATVRLPNCGNSWYGGKVKPRTWDRGCTGFTDLTRGQWSRWGKPVAYGRGYEDALGQIPVRIRASRIRVCETEDRFGTFYTRVWIKNVAQRGRNYRLICG